MSEVRSTRISGNTDFSIARILAADDRSVDREQRDARRKRRKFAAAVERDFSNRDVMEKQAAAVHLKEEQEERNNRVASTSGEICPSASVSKHGNNNDTGGNGSILQRTDLTWLQYTRYRPPKLPRRLFVEKRMKRRTGDRPRIPFSSSQLQVLEDRYRRNVYLSRNDVAEMSAMLRLPQSKVKIWFQNRRARQRRELLNSIVTAR